MYLILLLFLSLTVQEDCQILNWERKRMEGIINKSVGEIGVRWRQEVDTMEDKVTANP